MGRNFMDIFDSANLLHTGYDARQRQKRERDENRDRWQTVYDEAPTADELAAHI